MTTKELRSFNDHAYNVRMGQLNKQLASYKELIMLVKSIEADCDNVNELFDVINAKTGFLNSRMSFQALNLDQEFRRIEELRNDSNDINPNDLTNTLEFNKKFLNDLKTSFTTYYTEDQLKSLKAIDKVIEAFNKLPFDHRKLLGSNHSFELVKGPFFDRQFN